MDPKDQPQFNPKIPISEVLKQEQEGYTPSVPKPTLNDVLASVNKPADTDPGAENKNVPPAAPVKIIKTYRSDAAEAVKMQQASVTKMAMAEDERRRERGENIGEAPKKRFGLLSMAIILIILGAIAVPTVQYLLNRKTQEVPVSIEKTVIPFDHQENIILSNATRDVFVQTLATLNAKQPAPSTIEYRKVFEQILDVNKKTVDQKITADVFAGLIGPNMPSALARSFDSNYMYGIEGADNSKPFILFKTSSYEQTFANMLKWETKMVTDLNPVLNLSPDLFGRPFTDQVVNNKDVRAVTAPDGTILFLYGFLDNQTLIVTTSAQEFQDLNSRYVAAQFVQ